MVSKLDKLVVKVLGAKYGRIENRMREKEKKKAKLASCVWKGVERSKGLIVEGLSYLLGEGTQVLEVGNWNIPGYSGKRASNQSLN